MKLHSTPPAPTPQIPTVPFQVVIYLAKPTPVFPELEMRSCEQYALLHRWGVTLTVLDDETEKPPDRRPLLLAALKTITDRTAGAILTPSRAAISPIDGEFDDFAAEVEKAGGFLQVVHR